MSGQIDILMITHDRPAYTRLSLPRLLETCDESMRVWLWHNGEHGETLEVVRSLADHPRVHEFHHSRENRMLREPTNWLWQHAEGEYLSKVDDDCLVPEGWAQRLRAMHEMAPELGVVACWHFRSEDVVPELATRKIRSIGGFGLLENLWVGGSGYLLKRSAVAELGPLGDQESFSSYCLRLAAGGWINGWAFPLLTQEHMDDPRCPHTLLRSDEDLARHLPLSARKNGVRRLADWEAQLRRSARLVQEASLELRDHEGLRVLVRRLGGQLKRACGISKKW